MNQKTATDKLSSIKAKSFDVECVLVKSNLLKLIQGNDEIQCGTLCIRDRHLFQKVDREGLLNRVGQLKIDESLCTINFDNLSASQAQYVVKSCHENVKFSVSFNNIYNIYDSGLNDGLANFSFVKLNKDTAEKVIHVLRAQNFEFSLEITNISDKQVKFILQNASLEQEELVIKNRKVKSLTDLFMKDATPTRELNEFAAKGIEYIPEINERLFVPWRSVAAVAALGVGQVIFGGVLIATGFGSTVGMGFITEGIADQFTAFKAYYTRQFQWREYCMQKAISLAMSAVSMGYSKWKDGMQNAVKGVRSLTAEAGREVLEQAGTQFVYSGRSVGETVVRTNKNLKSLALKFVTCKAEEALAKESLNTGIRILSNFSLERLRPTICESIQSKVRSSFCSTELMGLLRKMYAIDLVTYSHQLQSRVEQTVFGCY